MDNEITVLVTVSKEELHDILVQKGFKVIEKFVIDNDYMVLKNLDLENSSDTVILKNCILVRDIPGICQELVYKIKKYDDKQVLCDESKVCCPILDTSKAVKYMEAINYKKLFQIHDETTVYANSKSEIAVQYVNDKFVFIEMEQKSKYHHKVYESITKVKDELDSYDLPYLKNDYFVQKAKLVLKDTLGKL